MAAKAHLRSVTETAPPPRRKHTVATATSEGDRLDVLVATQERIATAVDDADTPARDLAALTRRLLEINKEIDVLRVARLQTAQREQAASDQAFDASAV